MSNKFQQGETIICWRNVKDDNGDYVDPSTSMTVSIYDPRNGVDIEDAAMVKDGTGKYHYDYLANHLKGNYTLYYKATDGARITIYRDNFLLE